MAAYSDTTVVLLEKTTTGYIDFIKALGFLNIFECKNGEDVVRALNSALLAKPKYIITLSEADGFFEADIKAIIFALSSDSSKLYKGVRQNNQKQSFASKIYGFLSGVNSSDIESSLFGMSAQNCHALLAMKSAPENFISNISLEARTKEIPIEEIATKAELKAQPSYNILTRSFKLYYIFIKFSVAALIAYIIDIGTFFMFEHLFAGLVDEYSVLASTVLSRILCSIATYLLNRGAVFNSSNKTKSSIMRFLILSVCQLIASWLLVWGIGALFGGSASTNTIVKVVVDLFIFMASFSLQRDWVFKKTK